ncbi:hypothetical protein [Acinetobacter bereziniae]|uniref:hypothetical protein n=1 Tax=Acinetobacter bereziniae TaxID=106648 RepID=UPI001900B526|nr:hypothetical protein [Acinetobacter bereziniae]MBJ8552689.1 hypothetical protein [Acinetobacter bereziniae]
MISASHARNLQTDAQKVERLGIIAENKILETIQTGKSCLCLSIAKQLYTRQEVKQLIRNLLNNGFEVLEAIFMGSEDSIYYEINIWW